MCAAKTPLRILLSAYACEPDRGSEPGVGWHWALALVRRGHEVWVLTRANNQPSIEHAIERMSGPERNRLHFIYYDLPAWAAWWKKKSRGVQLYYLLWQINILPVARAAQATHQFDVVHHLTFGVWRQPTQLYKLGVPLIFGPVGGGETAPRNLVDTLSLASRSWELIRYLANRFATFNPALRSCLRESRWVISKTKETAAWIARAGVHSDIALEIGIDINPLLPHQERGEGKSMRCLYAGRLIGLKGIHLGIQALANAREKGCDISLTIVGKGPMRRRLKALSSRLNMEEHIQFIDWLDQDALFQQYHYHDVLLFPSLHDSSGNVILEAFAHGLPVVCFNLGGPGEIVDSSTGIAVEPSDNAVSDLSQALIRLATAPRDRARLGRAARRKAVQTSWGNGVANVYQPVENALSI